MRDGLEPKWSARSVNIPTNITIEFNIGGDPPTLATEAWDNNNPLDNAGFQQLTALSEWVHVTFLVCTSESPSIVPAPSSSS